MLNREQRRAMAKAKPPKRGRGHIELPINMRFSEKDERQLQLEPMLCAEKMRDGTADEGDWHTVCLRLNWARILNKDNFNEGEKVISDAQDAMRTIKGWGEQYNHWVCDPKEFKRIARALALSNDMQKMCTRRELRDALETVYTANEYLNKVNQIKDRLDA